MRHLPKVAQRSEKDAVGRGPCVEAPDGSGLSQQSTESCSTLPISHLSAIGGRVNGFSLIPRFSCALSRSGASRQSPLLGQRRGRQILSGPQSCAIFLGGYFSP